MPPSRIRLYRRAPLLQSGLQCKLICSLFSVYIHRSAIIIVRLVDVSKSTMSLGAAVGLMMEIVSQLGHAVMSMMSTIMIWESRSYVSTNTIMLQADRVCGNLDYLVSCKDVGCSSKAE